MKIKVLILNYNSIDLNNLILKNEINTRNFKNSKYGLSIY